MACDRQSSPPHPWDGSPERVEYVLVANGVRWLHAQGSHRLCLRSGECRPVPKTPRLCIYVYMYVCVVRDVCVWQANYPEIAHMRKRALHARIKQRPLRAQPRVRHPTVSDALVTMGQFCLAQSLEQGRRGCCPPDNCTRRRASVRRWGSVWADGWAPVDVGEGGGEGERQGGSEGWREGGVVWGWGWA